jgi:hypothetical protein
MTTAEHAAHHDDHHHELPTSGRALDRMAVSATLHCLTGCAIGEVLGMVIGTALGFSQWGTVALAVGLAFLFGYSLTSLPLLRAGFALSAVIPIALAVDTFSITTMEIVDNAVMLLVPGAMHSGVGSLLFWGALSFALVIAFLAALPVNRWLLRRGKGHAVLHETGIHGGPSPAVVGAAVVAMAIFGTTVLAAEAIGGDSDTDGAPVATASEVRGLAVSGDGMRLELGTTEVERGQRSELSFRILGSDGEAVRDFEVEHEKRMHLIVVRRDMTGFQHLHPTLGDDGTWRTRLTLSEAGSYRVFADFKRDGESRTLAADLQADGPFDARPLPAPATTARTADGYDVRLSEHDGTLAFTPMRDGRPVEVEPYLGAGGHLVALREGDLAYMHVHPVGTDRPEFEVEFADDSRYRLFVQFKHDGRVHTAAFTHAGSSLPADAAEDDGADAGGDDGAGGHGGGH